MRTEVRTFEAAAPPGAPRPGERTVVIDVLRASTTWMAALAAGARRIAIADSPEEARDAAAAAGDQGTWMAERDARTAAGAPLGNSPLEMTAASVGGRTLFATTSNGSRAMSAALARGGEVLLGSFVGFAALFEYLARGRGDVTLLCAGCDGAPAAEDSLLAGALALRLAERLGAGLDAASRRAARLLPGAALDPTRGALVLAETLSATPAGRRLAELGRVDDVRFAAHLDRFDLCVSARREQPLPVLEALRPAGGR
jgi:2-phosphosulfolactate phosphatase